VKLAQEEFEINIHLQSLEYRYNHSPNPYIVLRINIIKMPIEYSLAMVALSPIDLPIAAALFEVVAEVVATPLLAEVVAIPLFAKVVAIPLFAEVVAIPLTAVVVAITLLTEVVAIISLDEGEGLTEGIVELIDDDAPSEGK
jgi:hypothetical protein